MSGRGALLLAALVLGACGSVRIDSLPFLGKSRADPARRALPPQTPRAVFPAPAPGYLVLADLRDVDDLRDAVPYLDPERWVHVDVTRSVVTETRRRLYFEKEAVTRALLAHAGGEGEAAAPMVYEPGTVFVAESLDADGRRLLTEVLVVDGPDERRFLLYDEHGRPSDTLEQPNDPPGGPEPGNVPQVCADCHAGPDFFDPAMSFPEEPDERRFDLGPAWRDARIVRRFLEGYHRGSGLFAPYGALWLTKLQTDRRAGLLSPTDAAHLARLAPKYAELLDA